MEFRDFRRERAVVREWHWRGVYADPVGRDGAGEDEGAGGHLTPRGRVEE